MIAWGSVSVEYGNRRVEREKRNRGRKSFKKKETKAVDKIQDLSTPASHVSKTTRPNHTVQPDPYCKTATALDCNTSAHSINPTSLVPATRTSQIHQHAISPAPSKPPRTPVEIKRLNQPTPTAQPPQSTKHISPNSAQHAPAPASAVDAELRRFCLLGLRRDSAGGV